MSAEFHNVYQDETRADAYAELEFPGTYYLAYRDLPAILRTHIQGRAALEPAGQRGSCGGWVVTDGEVGGLPPGAFDLVLAAFTFDNIPSMEKKVALFRSLRPLLRDRGRVVTVVSTPEIYVNEWASFSTSAFPGNQSTRNGEAVRIVMLDVGDGRPVEDIVWSDAAYHEVYQRSDLAVLDTHRALGFPTEPFPWVSETTIAPWAIYVLGADAEMPEQGTTTTSAPETSR